MAKHTLFSGCHLMFSCIFIIFLLILCTSFTCYSLVCVPICRCQCLCFSRVQDKFPVKYNKVEAECNGTFMHCES